MATMTMEETCQSSGSDRDWVCWVCTRATQETTPRWSERGRCGSLRSTWPLYSSTDAFTPDGGGGTVRTTMCDMDSTALPGVVLDAELTGANIHWAVGKDRWAQLWADLDNTNLDMTPIPGPIKKALPVARFCIVTHSRAGSHKSRFSTKSRPLHCL